MTRLVLFFFISIIFISCNKKTLSEPEPEEVIVNQPQQSGFTNNPKKINGYMYACCRTYTSLAGPYTNFTVYATYSDPAINLMGSYNHYSDQTISFGMDNNLGNISVGKLSFNGIVLQPTTFNPNMFYRSNTNTSTNNFNYTAKWEAEGNRTFKEFNTVVDKGFPTMDASKTPTAISKSNNLVINLGGFITNYDSVSVMVYSNSFGSYLKKSVIFPQQTITFTSSELSSLLFNSFGCNISYSAFNYSNQVIENIVYVYELANKHNVYVSVNP